MAGALVLTLLRNTVRELQAHFRELQMPMSALCQKRTCNSLGCKDTLSVIRTNCAMCCTPNFFHHTAA